MQKITTLFLAFLLISLCAVESYSQRRKTSRARVVTTERYNDDLKGEIEIFRLVNRERSKRRVGGLIWDGQLARIARDYSRKMAANGNFSHHDTNGETVMHRTRNAGRSDWFSIGENLFVSYGGHVYQPMAVKSWLRSSGHKKNMLNSGWRKTGIGVVKTSGGAVYVTQIFTD